MSDLRLERKIVWLAALIQLANVLDFMIIMPLGPELTIALNIPSSEMGLLGGIYTFAAAVSGLLFAPYLDRFDRKSVAIISLIGLVISTFLCTLAYDTNSMLLARTLAGIFGGPVTAISLAMVVDMVPIARRGRAIAIVTSAFTVSSIFGIPLALELARMFSWHMPFLIVGGFGLFVAIAMFVFLPAMKGHIDQSEAKPSTIAIIPLLRKPEIQLSYILLGVLSFAQFMLFAGSINYFVFNLGFPREGLSGIYILGGVFSFAAMMITGRVVDRYGARTLSSVVAIIYAFVLADGYLHSPFLSVPAIFSLFMISAAIMGVICSSISSEAPGDKERAAYMSLQSTTRHIAAGLGGVISSIILTSNSDSSLNNIWITAVMAIGCISILPFLIVMLRRALNNRDGKV